MFSSIIPFKNLLETYEVFFIDIWGVVHDGVALYPGVVDTLNYLIANKKVLFLSNAPRPGETIVKALRERGINVTTSEILTSGDVVRMHLAEHKDKNIYHLGAERNPDLLEEVAIKLVSQVAEADLVVLSAYLEPTEPEGMYDDLLGEAVAKNLPLICANPDTLVPHGDQMRKCAGVLAAKYEAMGGLVMYFGKPHAEIFKEAIRRSDTALDKILMIGDTFDTDILGASGVGLDSAMVMTGNGVRFYPELERLYQEYSISPTYVIEGLWM